MERVHALVDSYLDQLTSAADLAELDQLLARDPAAAEALVRACRCEARLEELFREQRKIADVQLMRDLSLPDAERRAGRRVISYVRTSKLRWLAAAVLILAVGTTLLLLPLRRRLPDLPCDVVSGRVLIDGVEAMQIPAGSRIEVAGDRAAVILLRDGSRAELDPESRAVFHRDNDDGRQIVELDRGSGIFRVGNGGRSFQVDTPAGTVTARGTDFSIELGLPLSEGVEHMSERVAMLLAVAVLTGNVEVRSKGQSYQLASGQSRVFAGEEKPKGKIPMLTGKVTRISPDGKILTLETPPAKKSTEPGQAVLKLTEQTELHYFGVEKGGDRPTVGYLVTAILDADAPDTAVRVDFGVKDPSLAGRVVEVSPDGQVITLEVSRKGLEPMRTAVHVGERTRLGYSGIDKEAQRPTVGYGALVWLKEGSKETATEIQFSDKKKVVKGDAPSPDLAGPITAIAANGKVITLEVPSKIKGEKTRQTTIKLTEKTQLTSLADKTGGAKPTVGQVAQVWLDKSAPDTAVSIRFAPKKEGKPKKESAADPQLAGTIVAVAQDGKAFTLETPAKVKGGEPTRADVKITENTKFASAKGDTDSVKPTVGFKAAVWLQEGSKEIAAAVMLGKPKDGDGKKPEKKPDGDTKKPEKKPESDSKNPEKKPEADAKKPEKKPEAESKPKPNKEEVGARPAKPASKPDPESPSEQATTRSPAPVAAAIDRDLDQRLAEARIPVSPNTDDAEFLRRVSLDLTGHIPTADRVAAFLDDPSPDKRRRLVDSLLANPAYGQHFGTIWRNLIVPRDTSAKPQVDRFSPWLAEQFNRNRGWNEIIAELLTIEGDVQQPQFGFILANAEGFRPQPNLLAASASRLFLGVQLRCAECHNHPFAPWKQDDFWATAAFFSRLRNNGKKGPPFILTEGPATDTQETTKKGAVSQSPAVSGAAIVIPDSAGKGGPRVVKARFLTGPEPALDDAEALRPAYAGWVTSADNPYFAQAAVNRLWAHFFGRGLVQPVDDFHENNPPSHPALLRLLADELRASGYDLKHLIRCVCTSQAYQRTSRPVAGNETDTKLFSHMAMKVLSPEAFYDSLCQAMGSTPVPSPRGGKSAGGQPPQLESREQFVRFFNSQGESIESTDFTHGIPQLLKLMNAEQFNTSTPAVTQLVRSGASGAQILESLFLATLSRRPSAAEVQLMTDYVAKRPTPEQGYGGVLWILLNSSEFVLNH